jgi:hypothetical protein
VEVGDDPDVFQQIHSRGRIHGEVGRYDIRFELVDCGSNRGARSMQPSEEVGPSRGEGFDCSIIACRGGWGISNDASKAETGLRKMRHQFRDYAAGAPPVAFYADV